MADLGGWLTGAYRISRPLDEQDLDEGIPRGAMGDAAADSERLDGPRRDEDRDAPPPPRPAGRSKRAPRATRRSPKVN
jgi:hypothetical protein